MEINAVVEYNSGGYLIIRGELPGRIREGKNSG